MTTTCPDPATNRATPPRRTGPSACRPAKGKRDDRTHWGITTYHADCGPHGLLSHPCHAGLPCFEHGAPVEAEPTLLDALEGS